MDNMMNSHDPKTMTCAEVLWKHGIKWASGVPCSIMKKELKEIEQSAGVTWIPAVDEATGLGIVNGLTVGGAGAILMMQNSAMGAVADKLMSFNIPYEVPVFLYITMRGDVGDTVVHKIPFETTELALINMEFRIFSSEVETLDYALEYYRFRNVGYTDSGKFICPVAYLRYKDE